MQLHYHDERTNERTNEKKKSDLNGLTKEVDDDDERRRREMKMM